MTKHVLLNNVQHANLKVREGYGEEFGNNVNCVMTFPTEFADIQREYPILFSKNPETGEYQSYALLGLAKGENLFLKDGGWRADYIPAIAARGPFLIGFHESEKDGELVKEPMVHVDLDDARVNEQEGRPVFLPQGSNTPYLDHMAKILNAIHDGISVSQAMFQKFEELELIEQVTINVEVSADESFSLTDFYTISHERLAALRGEALEQLHASGFLQGAYWVMGSTGNLQKLIAMKQAQSEQ
ncbi:SapC family protein [Gilvimarinus polysaccharolyticus]|uniref:SapC family protein n=1 Tax=Gilvimarinus polysaccharolyticus TaxID=863921 RepID=UPI0006739E10|nr:SapC family protein [Gilvimarinus polysaccharolyticus]